MIRVLDMFSGGGGSSYGARAAGASIVAGIDGWPIASQTFATNFPGAQALNFRMEGEDVRVEVRALGKIDLLLASPECTNHTCARGSRPISDESRMTAWQVLHHARALLPRWIIVENVVQMRAWERFREFERELLALDYRIWLHTFDAADFGVPQSRRRLFMICSRDDRAIELASPERKHLPARTILDRKGTWKVSLLYKDGRAPATLERAERAFAELGQNEPFLLVYYGTDSAGGWQRLDRPLRTMTTLDRFALVEPSPRGHTMRMLQVEELRRAMGFGDDFNLAHGTRRDRVKVLGNGVCPPVMEHIVCAVTGKASEATSGLGRPFALSA
jgi:DNA (cytosine-5)-methyltransferase 1